MCPEKFMVAPNSMPQRQLGKKDDTMSLYVPPWSHILQDSDICLPLRKLRKVAPKVAGVWVALSRGFFFFFLLILHIISFSVPFLRLVLDLPSVHVPMMAGGHPTRHSHRIFSPHKKLIEKGKWPSPAFLRWSVTAPISSLSSPKSYKYLHSPDSCWF